MNLFFMPSKLVFENNAIINNKNILANFGKKALIITGANSARISGALNDVLNVLEYNKITYSIYDKVSENPLLSNVIDFKNKVEAFDFIIAIGGGSPIDFAKALSVSLANNLENVFEIEKISKAYKIIAVPTTAGTGTEATKNSVINDDVFTKRKKGFAHDCIFPSLSFIDPKYTLTLNKEITSDTAIDALSHLLEGIYSKNTSTLVYPYIIEGIKNIIKYLPLCLKDLSNLKYREKLSYAALYGGIAIAQTGTTLQHSIGYHLTYKYNISHGKTNFIFMKEIFNLYYEIISNRIDYIFDNIGITKEEFFYFLDNIDCSIEKQNYSFEFDNIISSVFKASNTYLSPIDLNKEIVLKLLNKVLN
jgi:alcohol dehydrogenase